MSGIIIFFFPSALDGVHSTITQRGLISHTMSSSSSASALWCHAVRVWREQRRNQDRIEFLSTLVGGNEKNCPCLSYKMRTELPSLSSHSPRLCLATRRPRQVSTLMLYYVNPSDYTLKIAVSIEWFGSAGGLDPCKPEISFMFCWREHSNICEMFPIYSQQTKNSQSDAILSRRHSRYTKWDPTGNWLSDFGDTTLLLELTHCLSSANRIWETSFYSRRLTK